MISLINTSEYNVNMVKKVTTIRIDEELNKKIIKLAQKKGISKNEVITEALTNIFLGAGSDNSSSNEIDFLKEQIRIKDEQIKQNQELAKALSVLTAREQEQKQPLQIEKKSFFGKIFKK